MLLHSSNMHVLPNELDSLWCVYSLRDDKDVVQFIGTSQLNRVYSIADARRCSNFKQYFPDDKFMNIQILDLSRTKAHAMQLRSNRLAQLPGVPMFMKYAQASRSFPIYCNETGETFRSLQEVAFKHGVGAGNLSKHLRGAPGHKTIKGRTYARISPYF